MTDHHFAIDYILGILPYVIPIVTMANQLNGMRLALTPGAYMDLLRALLRISAYRKAVSSSGILRNARFAFPRSMHCV